MPIGKAGRADELVEVVKYAVASGLVPMLMTHGQTLIEHPEFLERLMVEGGLRQVAVHIDMTQAGRHGYPIGRIKSEADLHPVREAFTQLALDLRKKTGQTLEFAHNVTVTRRNIDHIPEVIRWALEKPERTSVWRMFSFQPEADTGRTLYSEQPITPALAWEKICQGTGLALQRDFSIFGHPDCNSWCPLLVSQTSGRYLIFPPQDARDASTLRRPARERRRRVVCQRRRADDAVPAARPFLPESGPNDAAGAACGAADGQWLCAV